MWWFLWPLLGLLGWGWANYSIHKVHGPKEADDPFKWFVLVYALAVGPVLIWQHAVVAKKEDGEFHWGLRFK